MVNYQQNQNKQQFLIQGPYIFYCSVLLYQNIYLCKFWCYCCILLWTWKHLVFIIFHFSKKVKFGQKNLHSLLLDIWKKWILGPVTFFLFKSIYNNSSWDIDCEGLKLLLFGDVLHFYPPKNKKKSKFWKNKKNRGRYHRFTHAHQKPQSYDVQFLIYRETDRIFCHFGWFLVLLPRTTEKIKILKKWKKTLGHVIILHMRTKNQKSWYDVCFLRLDHFLPFYP